MSLTKTVKILKKIAINTRYLPWIILILVSVIFSAWLMFHTFSYDGNASSMIIAHKAWSDFGSHLPLTRSFSLGNNWPPEYPLFPGEPIRYHFLFYFLAGLLEKMGLRIDLALNLPSIVGLSLLMTVIYSLAYTLFKSHPVSILSLLFFAFNGSFSFLIFFKDHPLSFSSLKDIANASAFPAFAPWGKGDITAFWNLNIYTNQRHLALAFAIALLFMYSCLRLKDRQTSKQLIFAHVWGLIIGLFPFFHQPSLLIFAVILTVYFLFFPSLRLFLLLTAGIAASLILVQLRFLPKSTEGIKWYPGYLIHDTLSVSRFISYWRQNLGLHFILIPVGFILSPIIAKKTLSPLFIIFLTANLFRFSAEVAASHKFFNFVVISGNMLSAYTVVQLTNFIKNLKVKTLHAILTPMPFVIIIFLTISGVIDFMVVKNDAHGRLPDIPANPAAYWIATQTPSDAVFLNSTYLYHPASLAGRKVFLGWPYFSLSAGYDTNKRLKDLVQIYETTDPAKLCQLLLSQDLDFIEYTKRGTIEELVPFGDPFASRYQLLFENPAQELKIYKAPTSCNVAE